MARSPIRGKVPIRNTVKTATTTAPVQGLNTVSSYATMAPSYAISVSNFIATPQGLSVRQGYRNYVTNLPGYVQSLLTYKGNSLSSDRMFACVGTQIFDATNPTTTPVAVQNGLISSLWEHTNVTTNGGRYLVACNGVDNARFYDGTNWTNFSLNATPSLPGQITTGSMTNLSNWKQPIIHQRRLWITQVNSTVAYYLPVDSMGGAAVPFDFGPTFPRGGYIATMQSWSVDLGLGIQQFLVVVSTSGDVVIYAGNNPAVPTTWSLSGVWRLGEPVGMRCLFPYESDLLFLSQDGLMELSKYLKSTRIENTSALSLTIQPTISDLVGTFHSLPGFEMVSYPGANALLLNIPQVNADQNFQFVYNTITKGWTQFTGWGAQCWASINNQLYFGGNGFIGNAFSGYRDGANIDSSGGNSYCAYVQQAFNYFDDPGRTKRFVMARPNLSTAIATPLFTVSCNVDFNLTPPSASMSTPASRSGNWDISKFDFSTWGFGGQNFSQWQSISGTGYCASFTMVISVNDYTLWASTDWVYETGGIIG